MKIVLDYRQLNTMIDETKCGRPIEPIQIILTGIKGPFFSKTDMKSAYNQMPLDKLSQRVTNFFYCRTAILFQTVVLQYIYRPRNFFILFEKYIQTFNST